MRWPGGRAAAPWAAALCAVVVAVVGMAAVPAGAQAGPPQGTDPDVYAFGPAPFAGSTGQIELDAPIVDLAGTPTGRGYWEVGADGGVFAFGDAVFRGSAGGLDLASPIVAIAPTPDGGGYWLFAADGGVFAYGNAPFLGSLGGITLAEPVVDGTATPTGGGYWLAAADGGVFAFGDAAFLGSAATLALDAPVVGIGSALGGDDGYWLAAADGGIFSYGRAPFFGSAADLGLAQPIVDLAVSIDGRGYWLAGGDGGVFSYGHAPFLGSLAGESLNEEVVGIATQAGGGYWMATTGVSRQLPVGRPDLADKQSPDFPFHQGPLALLTDVRVAALAGFDRIVFEFEDAIPDWQVRYVDPPIVEDPTADVLAVDGDAFLAFTMAPSSAFDLSQVPLRQTYTGPNRIQGPVGSLVEELVKTGDFEAVMSWVAGLGDKVPFGVTTMSDPPRLIIDIVG